MYIMQNLVSSHCSGKNFSVSSIVTLEMEKRNLQLNLLPLRNILFNIRFSGHPATLDLTFTFALQANLISDPTLSHLTSLRIGVRIKG